MKQVHLKNKLLCFILIIFGIFPISCSLNKSVFPDQIVTAVNYSTDEKSGGTSSEAVNLGTMNWESINLNAQGTVRQSSHSLTAVEKSVIARREAHTKALENLSKTLSVITLSDGESLGKYLLKKPDLLGKINTILLNARVDSVEVTKDGSTIEKIGLNLKSLSALIDQKPSRIQKVLQSNFLESEKLLEERAAQLDALKKLYSYILNYKLNKKETVLNIIVKKNIDKTDVKSVVSLAHTSKVDYVNNKAIVESEFNLKTLNVLLEK